MLYSVHQGKNISDVPRDYDIVTMGINPSKSHVHQGHHATLFQAAKLLETRRDSQGIFFVDDREFDLRKMTSPSSRLRLPPHEVVTSIQLEICSFLQQAGTYLHDLSLSERVRIVPMSEYMLESPGDSDSHGFTLYQSIFEHRRAIAKAFGTSDRPMKQAFFRPTCPHCEEGAFSSKVTNFTDTEMKSICVNEQCTNEEYALQPQKDNRYFYNYTVDPLRDLQLAEQGNGGVIHVFGGDYGIPWGSRKAHTTAKSKAERIGDVALIMKPDVPLHHFVGPILLKDGQKLAKSNGDVASKGIDFELLDRIVTDGSPIVDIGDL